MYIYYSIWSLSNILRELQYHEDLSNGVVGIWIMLSSTE